MPDTATAAGAPAVRRLRWWTELPLIAVVYGCYLGVRLLVRGDVASAVEHGLAILRFEQWLGIDAETPLNRLFTHHPAVGIPADFVYASLHYVVTPAFLVWLWLRLPTRYRLERSWLLLSTMIGLIGYTFLPTCPPRLLDAAHGFVDTMAQYGSYGWWGAEASAPRGLGGLTNQYAAMPSLHVGWALWCGVLLWRYRGTPLAKAVGVAYPLLICVVVMGTANHYLLDAVAGAAVMLAGWLLVRPALRLVDQLSARFARRLPAGPADRPGEPAAVGDSAVVGDGCETSAGERIPRQPTPQPARRPQPDGRVPGSGTAVTSGASAADDGAPAAAR